MRGSGVQASAPERWRWNKTRNFLCYLSIRVSFVVEFKMAVTSVTCVKWDSLTPLPVATACSDVSWSADHCHLSIIVLIREQSQLVSQGSDWLIVNHFMYWGTQTSYKSDMTGANLITKETISLFRGHIPATDACLIPVWEPLIIYHLYCISCLTSYLRIN